MRYALGSTSSPTGPHLSLSSLTFMALSVEGDHDYEVAFALLRPVLATLVGPYDLVLIDCPPGNKVLVDAALGAAR